MTSAHVENSRSLLLAAIGSAALLAALTGCDRAPARIGLAQDTLTINTRFPNSAGARALTRSGETLSTRALAYRAVPESLISVTRDGHVTCRRSGDATLYLTAGAANAHLPVRCRLIGRIQMPFEISLPLGGPDRPVDLSAYDESKQPMGNVRVGMSVRDSSIVRLDRGMLKPVKFGRTIVDADAGGKVRFWVPVNVYEQVLQARPIAISPGAATSWDLQPGRYVLDLRLSSPDTGARIAVSWNGTYCGEALPPLESHLICLVRAEARHPTLTVGARGSAVSGTVSLVRSVAQ